MADPFIESIGTLAAVLTTGCWLPQALRILRTRDARSISLWSQSVFAAGTVLWLAYGILIMSWPVIGSNFITFALVSSIIALKIRFG